MNTRLIARCALAITVAAAAMEQTIHAQANPEGGPVLTSKAALPGDLGAVATAAGRDQLVALLRYASAQMLRQDSADASDWTLIARDQGIIKDLEGLKITAAQIQKVIDAETDADKKTEATDEAWPTLAGAFAWAGDKATSEKYAAKVPKDADPEVIGKMRAQMGDIPGVDAALAPMDQDDKEFAYGSIAEDIWIGDPVMAETLLQKLKNPDGTQQDFAAVHYATAGQIDKATKIATASDDPYYWKCIAEAYEENQDFAGAKTAKAAYLKSIATKKDAEQKQRAYTTFTYQMELEKPAVAAATEKSMVKYALAMMEVGDKKWNVFAGEAACAAAYLGDEANVAAITDAANGMPNDKRQHDYVAEAVKNGQADKLIAEGKADDAIAMAKSVTRTNGWGSWRAKEDIYQYAMIHNDIPTALQIEAGTGTTDMLHWVVRQLVKMQLAGTPLDGKPVDVFAFIAGKKDPYDRGEAAAALAEELIRRGAGK